MSNDLFTQIQINREQLKNAMTEKTGLEEQLNAQKQEQISLLERYSKESRKNAVSHKEREIEQLYHEENSLFEKSKEIDISRKARIEEELKIGPGRGRFKVEKRAWYDEHNRALGQENELIGESVNRRYHLLNLKDEAEFKTRSLVQDEQKTSRDYADLLAGILEKNNISQNLEEIQNIQLSKEDDRNLLQKLCQLLGRMLQPGARDDAKLLAEIQREWNRAGAFAGTLAEEQLEKGQDIGSDAAWVFILTSAANSLSKLVNNASVGQVSEESVLNVEALMYQTNTVCNGLYCSAEYGKLILKDQDARIHATEEELANLQERIRTLEKKDARLREQEEELKRQEEEHRRQEEERKRQEEERKKQEEDKIRLNEERNRKKENIEKIEAAVRILEIEHSFDERLAAKLVSVKMNLIRDWDGETDLVELAKSTWKEISEKDKITERSTATATQNIQIQKDQMGKIQKKKDLSRKAAQKATQLDRRISSDIGMGITPAMAGEMDHHLKERDKNVAKLTKGSFRKHLDRIDAIHPTLHGQMRNILVQIAMTSTDYQKFLSQKSVKDEKEDVYWVMLNETYSQIERLLLEKQKGQESLGNLEMNKDELLYFFVCRMGGDNCIKLLPDGREELLKEFMGLLKDRSQKREELFKLGGTIASHPLLSSLYRDIRKTISFLYFTASTKEFDKAVNVRMQYLKNAVTAAEIFEKLAENRLKLQSGLFEYFGDRVFSDKEIDGAGLEKAVKQLIREKSNVEFLQNSTELFAAAGSISLQNTEVKAFDAKSQEEFVKYLAGRPSMKHQMKKIEELEPNEVSILAMVLNFPEFLGKESSCPGMEWVEEPEIEKGEVLACRLALKRYIAGENFNAQVNYDRALETITGYSLNISAEVKKDVLDSGLGFVHSCQERRKNYAKRVEEAKKKLTPEFREKKAKEVEKFRQAVSEKGIQESKNTAAWDEWRKQKEIGFSAESVKEFLLSQAQRDKKLGVAAGILSLTEEQRKLFYVAITQRDCLDISKEHIGANRFGLSDREYANEEGRFKLIEDYFSGNELLVDYEKVVQACLSSRIDERRKTGTVYRTRSSAVDWKLVSRGLQLVNRCENERKLFGGQRLLSTRGEEYQPDNRMIEQNIHNAGNRFTRYLGSHAKDIIMDKLEGTAGDKVEDFIKYSDKVSTVGSLTKDGYELVNAIVNFRNIKVAEKGSASLIKEDQEKKQVRQPSVAVEEAVRMNESLIKLDTRNAKERSVDTMIETGTSIAGTIATTITEAAKSPAELMSVAASLVNILRSYVHEASNVMNFFEVNTKAGEYRSQLKADEHFKDIKNLKSKSKKLQFVREATGFEELTEMSSVVGINMTHALLFSASEFNDTQSNMKKIAVTVLKALGLESLIGDISHEAAQQAFEALMGEYR